MKRWMPTEVEADEIKDGAFYFIAQRKIHEFSAYYYLSRGLNGKLSWSIKPGIACHYSGNENLRNHLKARADLIALEIPADYEKRWRARKTKWKRK